MKTSGCCVIIAVHSDSDTRCNRDRNSADRFRSGTAARSFSMRGEFSFHFQYLRIYHLPTRSSFHMPLHCPEYTKEEHEDMPESKLDLLLASYGLSTRGNLNHKKEFAMGTFYGVILRNNKVESSPSHTLRSYSNPKENKVDVVEF